MNQTANPTDFETVAAMFKVRELSKAKKAKLALEALREEIGSQPWIEKAIVSCDALDWGTKLDKAGRPIKKEGTVFTWKELGIE